MRLKAALVVLMLSAASAHAQPVTYACVEERIVGWEPREGRADVTGNFRPSQAAKIMAFAPHEVEDGRIKRLSELAVTEDGKTYTYASNECDWTLRYAISDRQFGIERGLDDYLKQCADRLASGASMLREIGYGTAMLGYLFTRDPLARETPMSYSHWLVLGTANAYVSRGTCTLVQ